VVLGSVWFVMRSAHIMAALLSWCWLCDSRCIQLSHSTDGQCCTPAGTRSW
jgi:hypothetical protein